MKTLTTIIVALLFSASQISGQSVEPDTIVSSEYDLTNDSLYAVNDSIKEFISHPADSLYQNNWSPLNITYSYAPLRARKDTLMVSLVYPSENFVPPVTGKVISAFGTTRRPGHTGTDIKLNSGDTVRCTFDGQVRLSKRFSGYGNTVLVRHSNGMETIYAHLSKICVKGNQYLKAGELIGLGGRTGRATTDHLHFETRMLGEAFNPEKLIEFETGKLLCDTFYYHDARIEKQLADFRKNSKPLFIASGETVQYAIKSGDTLTSIARAFGTSIKNICALNNITPQKILKIGTLLTIQP